MNYSIRKNKSVWKVLLAILALALVIGFVPFGASAATNPAASELVGQADYTGYYVYSRSGPIDLEGTQHVLVEFYYPGTLYWDITTPYLPAGDLAVRLGGSTTWPEVVSGAGTDTLTVDLGPAYALMTGILNITSEFNGAITIDGDPIAEISLDTVAPTGVNFDANSLQAEQIPAEGVATVRVKHTANVRGMVHIGLYSSKNPIGPLLPLSTTIGNAGVYTFTTHAHDFANQNDEDFATDIVNAVNGSGSLPAGYTIAVDANDPAVITLTSADDTQFVWIYIFDDDLIQALNNGSAGGITYDSIVTALGVLPNIPDYISPPTL
ncbi:MAG: hypothetical protein LBS91_09025 [Clostridiales Family XIII bacterium]|jgi:hypothetical protein|nr:hypothetical protein [Clostridiales Family XIII bacterium]